MRLTTCVAVAALVLATNGVARAEPPTCGAPTTIDILRNQAIEHFRSSMRPTGDTGLDKLNEALNKIYFREGDFDIKVEEMFSVSRSEDVRECRASMHLVEPGRNDGENTVFYSVARSEDGHDLVAIDGEATLYNGLLASLKANNSDIGETFAAMRRDGERSINDSIRSVLSAHPDLNKPAPPPSASSIYGNSNRGGTARRFPYE